MTKKPLGSLRPISIDDYTWPTARGRGLQTRSIRRRLRDAAAAGRQMFIGALPDNGPSRHNIEELGFRPWPAARPSTGSDVCDADHVRRARRRARIRAAARGLLAAPPLPA